MTAFVALQQTACPRNKAVQIMFALDPRIKDSYLVGAYHKGRVYRLIAYDNVKAAMMEFEDEASRPGPEGDSDWLSVLARCRNQVPVASKWDGSAAEYAARFANIGTWEWVQILAAYRKLTDEVMLNKNNKEGTHGTDASAEVSTRG